MFLSNLASSSSTLAIVIAFVVGNNVLNKFQIKKIKNNIYKFLNA